MNYTTNYLHKWDIIGGMRMSLLHVWAVVRHHQGENTYNFYGIKWLPCVFRLHKILGVFLPDDGGRPLKDVEMIHIYICIFYAFFVQVVGCVVIKKSREQRCREYRMNLTCCIACVGTNSIRVCKNQQMHFDNIYELLLLCFVPTCFGHLFDHHQGIRCNVKSTV
jgi:hypothetical protein